MPNAGLRLNQRLYIQIHVSEYSKITKTFFKWREKGPGSEDISYIISSHARSPLFRNFNNTHTKTEMETQIASRVWYSIIKCFVLVFIDSSNENRRSGSIVFARSNQGVSWSRVLIGSAAISSSQYDFTRLNKISRVYRHSPISARPAHVLFLLRVDARAMTRSVYTESLQRAWECLDRILTLDSSEECSEFSSTRNYAKNGFGFWGIESGCTCHFSCSWVAE